MKTLAGFDINFVFLAYVPPYGEGEKSSALQCETARKENKTTEYLFKIFDASMNEAKIEILFNSEGNKQYNHIREEILSVAQTDSPQSKFAHGRKLAQRLYEETDERNGSGLFVIIEGIKAKTTRMVLMRFKGDEGLVNRGKKFDVDYIAEVFTKKSKHYKLAVYEDTVSNKAFWKGFSVDKQISANQYKSISFFWVEAFLASRTAITPAQGTLQFSKVIKQILAQTTDISEQEQIISGVVNMRNKKNAQMSIATFCKSYLSDEVTTRIQKEMSNDDFFNSVFAVDSEVYKKELGKTVLSLQDGITAYIPTFNYEKHVTETSQPDGTKNVTIHGKLSSKKINVQKKEKKQKPAKQK